MIESNCNSSNFQVRTFNLQQYGTNSNPSQERKLCPLFAKEQTALLIRSGTIQRPGMKECSRNAWKPLPARRLQPARARCTHNDGTLDRTSIHHNTKLYPPLTIGVSTEQTAASSYPQERTSTCFPNQTLLRGPLLHLSHRSGWQGM